MRHNDPRLKTLYRNYVRKWKFLIQELRVWSTRNGIPSSGLSPISTDFIRPTGRPSSSITTGSARAEPSTHLVPQPRGPMLLEKSAGQTSVYPS